MLPDRGELIAGAESRRPLVEVLYFAGCPNYADTKALVERISAEVGIVPEISLVDVADSAAAERLRFLGSPSVRVDGHDVEPSAATREDFAFSCRVYRTEAGISGQPDERWLRSALQSAAATAHGTRTPSRSTRRRPSP